MEELKFISYMIEKISEIEKCHKIRQVYYKTELDNKTYGWHNPYAPPEYRKSILMGESVEPQCSVDLFVLMIKCYEMINGKAPSENFQLNRKWKMILQQKMKGWDEEVQNSIIKLIGICTLSNPEKRIKTIDELKKRGEFIYVLNYTKRHIPQEDICLIEN